MSSPKKEMHPQLSNKDDQKLLETKNSKPILMTRRELTDPFGSDDEEESVQKTDLKESKPIESNGGLVNGTPISPKDEKDNVFSDLPKPNIVSHLLLFSIYLT